MGSLYRNIIEYIKDGIQQGYFEPNEQIPTEKELVEKFNVSRPTVSRALNELSIEGYVYRTPGKGTFVSERAVAGKSRNLARIVTLIVPFSDVIPERMDEIEIIKGVEGYLKEKGYILSLQFSDENPDLELQQIITSKEMGMNGIIIYPSYKSDSILLLNELFIENYPIVTLLGIDGVPISSVQSDNRKGGFDATDHLINQGYEEIFFISDFKIQSITSIRERYVGFCQAVKNANFPTSSITCYDGIVIPGKVQDQIISQKSVEDNLYDATIKKIMGKCNGKSAGVFVTGNNMACKLLESAVELSIKIPDEIGIVSFDDLISNPKIPLTAIRQNFYKIGRESAKLVVDMIENKKKNEMAKNIFIETEMIVRDSTSKLSLKNNVK